MVSINFIMYRNYMKKVYVSDTPQQTGKTVALYGWVSNLRDHKKIVFIDLRDSTGIVQVVGDEKFKNLHPEDVVKIEGTVKKRPEKLINKKLLTGEIEIEAKSFEVLSHAETPPFDMGKESLDVTLPTLLDYRSLTLRHPKVSAIFKVQEKVIDSFREILKEQGFREFQAPILVPAQAEGGAETFAVEYFDHKAYLGQSPQLYKQIMLGVFDKVFTVTHAFRAEPSVTTRHITEYISLDAEMAFIESWEEIMDTAESVVKKIIETVEESCSKELQLLEAVLPKVSEKFPRLTLTEAQDIIFERTKRDVRKEPDLSPADEDEICKWANEQHGSELVFITHYPTSKRPFYTYPDPKNPELTLSFDLIGRGIEWITGGQRINDYKQLVSNLKKWGDDPANYDVYLQAFKYGMPPEGGFAMGAERITMKLLNLANVREAALFPRDMERVDVRLSKKSKKS